MIARGYPRPRPTPGLAPDTSLRFKHVFMTTGKMGMIPSILQTAQEIIAWFTLGRDAWRHPVTRVAIHCVRFLGRKTSDCAMRCDQTPTDAASLRTTQRSRISHEERSAKNGFFALDASCDATKQQMKGRSTASQNAAYSIFQQGRTHARRIQRELLPPRSVSRTSVLLQEQCVKKTPSRKISHSSWMEETRQINLLADISKIDAKRRTSVGAAV